MDKRGEINNRWIRVFEQKTPEAKKVVLDRIKDNIIDDVQYLITALKDKETDLADALSPVSSRMGSLVIPEDGILKYRINGRFVDIKTVIDGLKEFVILCNMESLENRVYHKVDLKTLREVFEDPFKQK